MDDLRAALMPTTPESWWILIVSAMTSVSCALVGCFLVLRRMSLLGDALAHAVLPGLVIAFIWSGSLAIGTMFVGAFLIGLLTTFLTETLHRRGGVAADASMGIVFTSLFALGVVLIKRYAQGVHLDADCVFQGQLSVMPFYQAHVLGYDLTLFGHAVPRAFASIAPTLVLNSLFTIAFWKELKISSFDPGLATALGLKASLMQYGLMALVAATAVGSFEAVGSILVIAMLIVPAATAQLLCDRLLSMIGVAVVVALGMAYFGYVFATQIDAEPAGMMAVMGGVFYSSAAAFAPRYGIVSTLVRNRQTSLRIVREDLLAMLYRLEELASGRRLSARQAVEAVGGGAAPRWALGSLVRRGLVAHTADTLQLTDAGRREAKALVRSHRLWEGYLVRFLGLPLDHVHVPAERMEHFIGDELASDIAVDLGGVQTDPHGREIPEVTKP